MVTGAGRSLGELIREGGRSYSFEFFPPKDEAGEAQLWDDADPAATCAAEDGQGQTRTVVDVYLIDVEDGPAGPAPVSYRERIKALGPSNIPTHGKQAAGGPEVEALRAAHGAARSTGRVNLIKRK